MAKEESLEGQSLAHMARAFSDLATNPKTAPELKRLIKKLDPDLHIPELETEEKLSSIEKKFDEKLSKLEEQLQRKAAMDRWNEVRMAPVKAGLLKEEDIPALEERMKKDGFAANQYLQAAKHYDMERRLAEPTGSNGLAPKPMPEEDLKALRADPKSWLRKQNETTPADLRNARASGTPLQ
jgi:hypothetical protein